MRGIGDKFYLYSLAQPYFPAPPVIDPCNKYNPVIGLRPNVQNSNHQNVVRFAHINLEPSRGLRPLPGGNPHPRREAARGSLHFIPSAPGSALGFWLIIRQCQALRVPP